MFRFPCSGSVDERKRDMITSAAFSFLSETPLRPVSLGSLEVMRLMGITILDAEVELSLDDEERQISVFQWLHSESIADVMELLWSGLTWQQVGAATASMPDSVRVAFRVERDRLMKEIAGATVAVRAKPRRAGGGADDRPADLVPPRLYDYRLCVLMSVRLPLIPRIR